MTSDTPKRGDAMCPVRQQWTKEKKQRFLEVLADTLNVSEAARAVGMDRSHVYAVKARDPAFAQGWRAAFDDAYDEVEMRLLHDSRDGETRTETVHDVQTNTVKQKKTVHAYPHAVAMRLLFAHRREVALHRAARAQMQDDEDVIARVRAHMDEVRDRLQRRFATMAQASDDER